MPSLFRPSYTDKKTGKLVKTKKWYGKYRDANGALCRVPLSANKTAAQAMLAELVKATELGKAGIRDPFVAHRKTLMTQHCDDWLAVLTARGRDAEYTALKRARVTAIISGCEFNYPADLSAEKLERFLESLRKGEVIPPTQAGKKKVKPKKLSVQTANDYLQAVSQLCVWMVENERMERNPFERVKKGNAERDRRHVRRVLSAEELQRLIATTQTSPAIFRHLTGFDRAILYATAAATGYRAGELAALTPRCFVLDTDQPSIDLDGDHTKNGKAAMQPVSATLADVLRPYLAGKAGDELVWPGSWSDRGADMIHADAQAAGIATEVTTRDGVQVLDFHSLRGTFATLLDTINISLKTRQELMRHSDPRLTMNRYTAAKLAELGEAATKLPVMMTPTADVKPAEAVASACPNLVPATDGDSGSERATAVGEPVSELASILLELLENPENHVKSAERAGFEPAVGFYPHAALAKRIS